jgi:hypothetical protein
MSQGRSFFAGAFVSGVWDGMADLVNRLGNNITFMYARVEFYASFNVLRCGILWSIGYLASKCSDANSLHWRRQLGGIEFDIVARSLSLQG